MSYLGLGVLIDRLCGIDEDEVNILKNSIGKTINKVECDYDELVFKFTDGTKITLFDAGQSCCEKRYMQTDDDLSYFEGAVLQSIEIRDGGTGEFEDGNILDCQFMVVMTSKGSFTVSNYVNHNGYYGGFSIRVKGGE